MEETAEKKKSVHMGKNISFARTGKRMITQQELADEINITQSEVSRIERTAELDDETINLFAKFLDVSPDFIRETNPEDYMGSYNPITSDIDITHNSADNSKDNTQYISGNNIPEQNNYFENNKAFELYERMLSKAEEENKELKQELKAEIKELRDILIKR